MVIARLNSGSPLATSVPVSEHTDDHAFSKQDIPTSECKQSVGFDCLPLNEGDPPYSAWGLWGDEDELGALNILTDDIVRAAAREVRCGLRVPLNLPLESPLRPMNPVRKCCQHRVIAKGRSNDDELDINTQGSSHFDGLRHYPYQGSGCLKYYNGVLQENISGPSSNNKLGIHNVARSGIAGRAVLLDWAQYASEEGIQYSPFDRYAIPLKDLQEVARRQQVEFYKGDILIIRTGWTAAYNELTPEEKLALPDREIRASCGLEASLEALKWHWDHAFAAVASDTVAYEVWPSPRLAGVSMHEVFLSGWGMMIGESWDLESLAEKCRRLRKWTFFLTCQPLNILGGVASPSNAMAIL